MLKNETILVTGAAGFIGSHTCEELIGAGFQVVGIDNLRTGRLSNLDSIRGNDDFSFLHIDCLDWDKMDGLFELYRFTRVIHLAALVSVPESFIDPKLNFALNVEAVDNVARLCGDYEVEKLVFASSAAVYGDTLRAELVGIPHPLSPYAVAKLTSETLIKGYASCHDFNQTCLRYFNVYGPRQDPTSSYSGVISIFSDKYKKGEAVTVFGNGDQTRDFIHVKDVARANRLALLSDTNEEQSLDICTGRSLKLNYLLALLQIRYSKNPLPIHTNEREGDIKHSSGNNTPASERIGFEAKIPFEDGVIGLI